MAPSAPEATGPSKREQPKDRAAAQPSSPCHLRSQATRTCPPSHGGAPRALAAARLLKKTLVSADQRPPTSTPPPTWHGHARQSTRGKSFLSFAWHASRTARRWLLSTAEGHHRAREGKPWWCPPPTGRHPTVAVRQQRFPADVLQAGHGTQIHATHRQIRSDTPSHFSADTGGNILQDPTTTTQNPSICARCTVVAKDVEGTAHRQERACRGKGSRRRRKKRSRNG